MPDGKDSNGMSQGVTASEVPDSVTLSCSRATATSGRGADVPMTILLVSPYVPPHLGGVEKYVFNLGVQLVRRHGARVIIAATAPSDVSKVQTENLFHRTGAVELRWLPAIAKVSNTPVGLGWVRELRRVIREENVTLVNAHGPVPLVADVAAVASSGTPFVLTYHFGPMAKGRYWADLIIKLYEGVFLRRTVCRSDAVIAVSEYVKATLPMSKSCSSQVINPAVDTSVFSPGNSPSANRVLFVGTLTAATRHKGLSDLIEAVRLLNVDGREVILEVVGDGDDLQRYKRLADELGQSGNVRFSGALQGPDLADAYRRCALLVVPSRSDNYPTVAIEAMACGRPVVATAVGSIPDLVENERTGIIVPPAAPTHLAGAILKVLDNTEYALRMGREARETAVSRYGLDVQAARTMALFKEVCHRARAS